MPQIDPRGPRFAAAITTVVLAVVLLVSDTAVAPVLLAVQALVFGLGTVGRSPYGEVYKRLIRPRLAPPAELEDARPPQFAQGVGLGFAVLGVLGFVTGATALGLVATAAALAAAFLNAAFGLCLGCEMYLLFRRATTSKGATA